MFTWSKIEARKIMLFLAAILLLSGIPQEVSAQDITLNLVMEDVQVHAVLNENGTSFITFSANVTNIGPTTLDSFDVRVDLRDISIDSSVIDGTNSSSVVISESNYALIRLSPQTSFSPLTSHQVEVEFSSNMLQENVGICEVRNICLTTAIFYVRPLNEFRNFVFKVTLPPHAILDTESSPLYPAPTQNFTDGRSLIFLWETEQILPGQERVFIIKYGTPNSEPVLAGLDINIVPFLLFAAVGGAVVVVVAQKLPEIIRTARVPRALRGQGMTEHEEQIIQLLTRKGGSCSQRDIYDDLGMSQSLASMVLTGLEQRGVVRRFREGRKNVVHLIDE